MNREISFRAWDRSKNLMHESIYSIEWLNGGIKTYGTGVYVGNGWVTSERGFEHECDAVLMQYTGLRDSQAKKMYEGDIVRSELDGICVIIYVQCAFCLIDKDSKWKNLAGQYMNCEIIGNRYENPELL